MKYFPKVLTIDWIRKAYLSEALTPEELFMEILKRVDKYEDYNIWISRPTLENLISYLERLKEMPIEKYPLWGIPFAVKDNIDVKIYETTAACKEFAYRPKENATVVENLISAGAIPIGKTNLDQFATGLVGTRSPYGEVKNAINPELISGGSSSGSAVSVALGLAAFSLGTDTAGSGRVPAALNGLIGYKPPLGSWSTKGVVPACASLDCVTVFANNLSDASCVNEQARGWDSNCIWSRKYDDIKTSRLKKVLLPKEKPVFYGDYKGDYEASWDVALKRFEMMDICVEYIDTELFSKAAAILYDGPWVAERWKDLGAFIEAHPGQAFPVTEQILRSGNLEKNTAVSMFQAMHQLQEYKHEIEELLKDAVLVMPTAGGTFTREQVRKDPIATNSKMGLYTNHCNLLDLCAVNVPVQGEDQKMPFGISVFALAKEENVLQRAAKLFCNQEMIQIAVCGLHKKGMPLEYQLTQLGGYYKESTKTAADYRLYALATIPVKPGLVKSQSGNSIEVDIYEIPIQKLGEFMKEVAAPLVIGNVELSDGRLVKGFLCEEYALEGAKDLTEKGYFS